MPDSYSNTLPLCGIRVLGVTILVIASVVAISASPAWAAGAIGGPATPSFQNADYFQFADRVAAQLDPSWSAGEGSYLNDTYLNALMLTVHATAALYNHVGASRNDDRVRALVSQFVDGTVFYHDTGAGIHDKMFHTPGWTANMRGRYALMDKSIDPKVAEGLSIAWQARDTLHLSAEQVAAIADRIDRVAHTAFFRYPKVRLNQINWPAELYFEDWLVTGKPELLKQDYRQQMRHFVAGIRKPLSPGGAPNLSPSYRFIYQMNYPAATPRNLDSAEYANMTLYSLNFYRNALRAGMRPLPKSNIRLLRAWEHRDLFGYWTHAGFLNWDTGWSYGRWMQGKEWAWAQEGLLAIANTPNFNLEPRDGQWAKYIFDRGLQLYEHFGDVEGAPSQPSAMLFGIGSQPLSSARIFWARMAANAVRAVRMGLGSMAAAAPPPMYSYDADIGRLAVSTPNYSTAIITDGRSILPYGGRELARLYNANGDPVGDVAGVGAAGFGLTLFNGQHKAIFNSQTALKADPPIPALVLTASPHGPVRTLRRYPLHPDAGPFHQLRSLSVQRPHGIGVQIRHSFDATSITTSWSLNAARGKRAVIRFPSWGADAGIDAVMKDHTQVALAAAGNPCMHRDLKEVVSFVVHSAHGSYSVQPLTQPAGDATAVKVSAQKSNPNPGPELQLGLHIGRGHTEINVRIVPQTSGSADPQAHC